MFHTGTVTRHASLSQRSDGAALAASGSRLVASAHGKRMDKRPGCASAAEESAAHYQKDPFIPWYDDSREMNMWRDDDNFSAPRSYPSTGLWSTMAYMISRKGMRDILEATDGWLEGAAHVPMPVVADHLLYSLTPTYTYTRPLFRQTPHESYIQDAKTDAWASDGRTNEFIESYWSSGEACALPVDGIPLRVVVLATVGAADAPIHLKNVRTLGAVNGDTASTVLYAINAIDDQTESWLVQWAPAAEAAGIRPLVRSSGRVLSHGFDPKLVSQLPLIYHHINTMIAYDYVFAIDGDIRFRPQTLPGLIAGLALWRPLIAQPTICTFCDENRTTWFEWGTQWNKMLNEHAAQAECGEDMSAVDLAAVEEQAPILSFELLQFYRPVLAQFASAQHEAKCDWGHDEAWCAAAARLSEELLAQGERRPACVLLPHAVDHMDTKELDNVKGTGGSRDDFYEACSAFDVKLRKHMAGNSTPGEQFKIDRDALLLDFVPDTCINAWAGERQEVCAKPSVGLEGSAVHSYQQYVRESPHCRHLMEHSLRNEERANEASASPGTPVSSGEDSRSPGRGACGLLYFEHIPKTGGTTVNKYLEELGDQGWDFQRLFWGDEKEDWVAHPEKWKSSAGWRWVQESMERNWRPKMILEGHHGAPGLEYMLDNELKDVASELERRGCALQVATVLREPISCMVSSIVFNGGDLKNETRAIEGVTWENNAQARYLLHGHPLQWPDAWHELALDGEAQELDRRVQKVLARTSLVGTTERLADFMHAINDLLGVSKPAGQLAVLNPSDDQSVELSKTLKDAMMQASLADRSIYNAWSSGDRVRLRSAAFPAAIIVGAGKCGTNALASALETLGMRAAGNTFTYNEEMARQGWAGEINWPCSQWSGVGLQKYRRHFTSRASSEFDKSTALLGCAANISAAMPKAVKFFVMLCDPLRAVWSRMNHNRVDPTLGNNGKGGLGAVAGDGGDPWQLVETVRAQLAAPTKGCDALASEDATGNVSVSLCDQLNEGLRYAAHVKEWREAAGDRVKFLLAEASESNATYLAREAAAHLDLPLRDAAEVGEVHSHEDEAGYIEPGGPLWDKYVALAGAAMRTLTDTLDAEQPGLFGPGETAAKWWPAPEQSVAVSTTSKVSTTKT